MAAVGAPGSGLLSDIFGLGAPASTILQMPKIIWLPAEKGKGLEIQGTFNKRAGTVTMEMTFTNKAMQAMSGFAIQLNKNSFGLTPGGPLQVPVLQPSSSVEVSGGFIFFVVRRDSQRFKLFFRSPSR